MERVGWKTRQGKQVNEKITNWCKRRATNNETGGSRKENDTKRRKAKK